MARQVACGRCGKPNPKALCVSCRAETYGSSDYQVLSKMLRQAARNRIRAGHLVFCIICENPIQLPGEVTVEHRVPVYRGGTNNPDNLGPAHASCNYSKAPGGGH